MCVVWWPLDMGPPLPLLSQAPLPPLVLHLQIMHCPLSLSLKPNPPRKGHVSLQPFKCAFVYRFLLFSLVM